MTKCVAILATNGVEACELAEPRKALEAAGIRTVLVAPEKGTIRAMEADVNPAGTFTVDATIGDAADMAFDGVILPGGTTNPDALRMNEAAVAFLRGFVSEGKPIASICHGAWTLIEAGGVKGRTLTSWPSLQTDLINAGGTWVDRAVVVDRNLVTSRCPDDLPGFCEAVLAQYG
ncbi:type 1 glutamine amidotransferase domain-containing protein [Swaminathania salitolerans]|uniref:Glutamine amidotransferase n=1 Tax=Swaminathania salitolerans TaxID=182838 RepID=A0A511BRS2_9PROT|nr:type 1 glutamine amidotransferase domain-containing protein [Swaminathania salitolerans]GBQ14385.1 protease I [Swaminathania salitolerans LMG 21291]GEL03019.1 glutamine amidotransferase [Swaminathania salitolerans]